MKGEGKKIAEAKAERARRRDDPEVLANDKLDKIALDAAVDAAIAQLRRCLERNPSREIRLLGRQEVAHICIAAIGAWVSRRSFIEDGEQLDAMLTGPSDSVIRS